MPSKRQEELLEHADKTIQPGQIYAVEWKHIPGHQILIVDRQGNKHRMTSTEDIDELIERID